MEMEMFTALRSAGVPEDKARAATESVAHEIDRCFRTRTEPLATKGDLAELRSAITELRAATQADIADLRATTQADIADLRATAQADIADLRSTTQADIAALRSTTEAGFADLRSTAHADVASLRSATEGNMAEFRAEVRGEFATIRTEFVDFKAEIIKWVAGLMIAQTAALGVIIKLVH
ncbi:uncharacterized protein E1O_21610 [Burkholderiales bacterium GJ-E10]|nr:uncharacterized protein E1O_21610 [Burkholderiales bacterium GJ-E10]